MDLEASLANLQTEACCPIYLDYFREPVTIDCGHNFCQSCIHKCWEYLQDIFPCPICLHHCLDRKFRRNTQLCHMTDTIKQLSAKRNKRKLHKEKSLCEKHEQRLVLFCETDLELLCSQCRISSDHKDHYLMPLEQAATTYRKKLKSYIEPLKNKVEEAERGLEMQVSKLLKLWVKVENRTKEFNSEFERLKDLLKGEQDAILGRLLAEEKVIQELLIENNIQISDYIATLKNMLSEITEKYTYEDIDLLASIESVQNRSKNLKAPTVYSYQLKRESCYFFPQYFGLPKMNITFKVDLTLDPETAHPSLIISEDRKSVNYAKIKSLYPYNPKRFTSYPALLSSEGFDGNRHFWKVEVRGRGDWSVGICKDSFPRNVITSALPKDGCWQIQILAMNTEERDTVQVTQIGIFLDYDLGQISFYNWSTRAHIYTFVDTFTEKVRPYFSMAPTSHGLTLRIITDE